MIEIMGVRRVVPDLASRSVGKSMVLYGGVLGRRAENDSQAVMWRVAHTAVTEISGVTDAAMSVLEHGEVTSAVHAGEVINRVGRVESRIRALTPRTRKRGNNFERRSRWCYE